MNIPYVKQFDKNGVLTNPIIGSYKNSSPNRQARNSKLLRNFNNRGNATMNVTKKTRYAVKIQRVPIFKNGVAFRFKPVVHYVLK